MISGAANTEYFPNPPSSKSRDSISTDDTFTPEKLAINSVTQGLIPDPLLQASHHGPRTPPPPFFQTPHHVPHVYSPGAPPTHGFTSPSAPGCPPSSHFDGTYSTIPPAPPVHQRYSYLILASEAAGLINDGHNPMPRGTSASESQQNPTWVGLRGGASGGQRLAAESTDANIPSSETSCRPRRESERRQRQEIKAGFTRLNDVLPNPSHKHTRVTILDHAATYIHQLEASQAAMQARLNEFESEVTKAKVLNEQMIREFMEQRRMAMDPASANSQATWYSPTTAYHGPPISADDKEQKKPSKNMSLN